MAQYPSYSLGSGMSSNRQTYGLTGMQQSPDFSGIIRRQAGNLPALYALRGSQKQKERELSLAEQALTQNAEFEKERLATTERLANEDLMLTRSLAQSEMDQRQQLAEEGQAFQEEQAGRSNLIGGISTGVSALSTGKMLYDTYQKLTAKKAGEEATNQAAAALNRPETQMGTNMAKEAILSSSSSSSSGAGAALGGATWDSAAATGAGYGGDLAASFGAGSASAANAAAAGMTAGEMELAGIGATGAGTTAGAGAGALSALSYWAGPAAIVAGFVTGVHGRKSIRRKGEHAREDWANSPEGKAYGDVMDQQHLDWTQNSFLNMSPTEREGLVSAEINREFNTPSGMIMPASTTPSIEKIVNQFGGLLPAGEREKYIQMYADAYKKREQGRSSEASGLVA